MAVTPLWNSMPKNGGAGLSTAGPFALRERSGAQATEISLVRHTSWVAFSSATPSSMAEPPRIYMALP